MTKEYLNGELVPEGLAAALAFAASQETRIGNVIDLADVGRAEGDPKDPGESSGPIPIVIASKMVGDTETLDAVDLVPYLEKYAAKPDRKRIHVTLTDADSFIAYLNEQKEKTTRIFATEADIDARSFCFEAPIDFIEGTGGAASWITHTVKLELETTPEFNTWTSRDGAFFGQVDFAEFLDDNLIDITDPPGADILEVVQNLQVKTDVAFRSNIRLDNGDVQLLYEETSEQSGAGAKGSIDVPTKFTLNIPVFRGTEPTPIDARFRYRLDRDNGRVRFGYRLSQVDRLVEAVVNVTAERIEKETAVPIFKGTFSRVGRK